MFYENEIHQNLLELKNQVQNNTQIRKNQKVVENNGNWEVKKYPKNKQPIQQQPKIEPLFGSTCKQINWLDFDEGYYLKNCEHNINEQKRQIDKKNSWTR